MSVFESRPAYDGDSTINLQHVENYLSSDEFQTAVSEPDFEARCVALFNALDNGEQITLADAANFLGLPWDAFGVFMAIFAPSYLVDAARRVLQ